MKVEIKVPGVGESITEGLLALWMVEDGALVAEGQALFELETDKTTIEVTAPASGKLEIGVSADTDVVIDQVVGMIDTAAEAAVSAGTGTAGNGGQDDGGVGRSTDAAVPGEAGGDSRAETGSGDYVGGSGGSGGRITPGAKAAAERSGISVEGLTGGGRGGMVTKADVAAAGGAGGASGAEGALGAGPAGGVRAAGAERSGGGRAGGPGSAGSGQAAGGLSGPAGARAAESSSAGRKGSPEISERGEIRKPLSRIRRAIAANLARTRDELVLLTTFNEADMSTVKALRAKHGEAFRERHGVKLGFMGFFLKAAAAALGRFPDVNAVIDGEKNEVVYRDGVHISVAVSTPKGLVTPVLRHAQAMNLADIERGIIDFGRKAGEKTLMPDDLIGGTFTVTNGGIFGSMMSTPLPAPGQSAILGMHAIQERPVVREGAVVIRPMMYLALSYDHRLIDGREAVGCLKMIKEGVEDPERLLLEL